MKITLCKQSLSKFVCFGREFKAQERQEEKEGKMCEKRKEQKITHTLRSQVRNYIQRKETREKEHNEPNLREQIK